MGTQERESDFERMWQMLRETTELANKTANNLAELAATVKGQQASISELKQGPSGVRSAVGTYGGCVGMIVAALLTITFSGAGLIVSLIALAHTLAH